MIVERHVDYLVYNSHKIPPNLEWSDEIHPSPIRNYRYMMKCTRTGATCHSGNKRTDKYHIVLSGQVLQRLPMSVPAWVETELSMGSEFTRIDLAITQYIDADGLVTRDDIRQWYRDGKIQSRWSDYGCMSLVRDYVDADGKHEPLTETTYIGSWDKRAKKGIFRSYDKGLEMDLEQYMIARHEIEDKREKAHVLARNLANGESVGSLFRARFDVKDAPEWDALFDCEASNLGTGIHTDEKKPDEDERLNRWGWLVNQVAPSLGKAMAEDALLGKGFGNWDVFLDAVKESYNQSIKKGSG